MKSTADCIYCYLRQAHNVMKNAGLPEEVHPEILYGLMDTVKSLDVDDTPCHNSTIVIKETARLCGNPDPFKDEKADSNTLAKRLLQKMKDDVEKAGLHRLLQISSAGNIIDSGIVFRYDIEKTMEDTVEKGFSVDHYGAFEEKLKKAGTILYLGDNCGEIVFDEPVVRFLHESGKRIYYAVKSEPVLNDALYGDAVFAGIGKSATILETGSGFLGVDRASSSPEFLDLLDRADLVISKGQANFESLDEDENVGDRIFFILKIKCERVAERIPGSSMGDSVLYHPGFGGL